MHKHLFLRLIMHLFLWIVKWDNSKGKSASLITFQHGICLHRIFLHGIFCCFLCQECLGINLEADIDGYDMHCTVSVLYSPSLMLNVWYIYPTFTPKTTQFCRKIGQSHWASGYHTAGMYLHQGCRRVVSGKDLEGICLQPHQAQVFLSLRRKMQQTKRW